MSTTIFVLLGGTLIAYNLAQSVVQKVARKDDDPNVRIAKKRGLAHEKYSHRDVTDFVHASIQPSKYTGSHTYAGKVAVKQIGGGGKDNVNSRKAIGAVGLRGPYMDKWG